MKKLICAIIIIFIFCLSACGQKEKGPELSSESGSPVTDGQSVIAGADNEDSIYNWDSWTIKSSAFNNAGETQFFHIAFPTGMGRYAPYGKTLKSNDGTFVLLGTQIDDAYPCAGIEDAFTAYLPQIIETVEDKVDESGCSDFDFSVSAQKTVDANGIPACRLEGTHTYQTSDGTCSKYFVAYTAQLSKGAYIYWVVLDDSDDQSLRDTVIYVADTMATTLGED